jgi:hypothetical protein
MTSVAERSFDPQKDIQIEFLSPVHERPAEIEELFSKHDSDGIHRFNDAVNKDRKKLAAKIAAGEDPNDPAKDSTAWIRLQTGNDEDLRISSVAGVGTIWRWTEKEKKSTTDGDIRLATVVRIGTYSEKYHTKTITGFRFTSQAANIPYQVFKVSVSFLASGFVMKLLKTGVSLAMKWLAETSASLLARGTAGAFAGALFVYTGGAAIGSAFGTAAISIGTVLTGLVAGTITADAIDQLFEYAFKTYNLRVVILNYTEHPWKTMEFAGNNETLGEGITWTSAEIPPIKASGSEYHVPGIGQVTNTAPVASQAQYIFHNKVQLAGFTVVMSLGRSDKLNEGFNFAYHVDKVTRDSMALTPGPVAAQTYYDDKLKTELKTTHRLEIESPTRIAAYSPALETAEDDKHVIRVEIGKAPEHLSNDPKKSIERDFEGSATASIKKFSDAKELTISVGPVKKKAVITDSAGALRGKPIELRGVLHFKNIDDVNNGQYAHYNNDRIVFYKHTQTSADSIASFIPFESAAKLGIESANTVIFTGITWSDT